jgi:hypothetical protein
MVQTANTGNKQLQCNRRKPAANIKPFEQRDDDGLDRLDHFDRLD